MPISATGADNSAGFTLVELMVVMVIIGLMAAAVMVSIPDPRGRVVDDAETLAARMVAARDLAIVGGRDIAVQFDTAGYDFSERRNAGWQPVPAKALKSQPWREGTETATEIEGGAALVFDSTGLATPALVTLRRDGASADITVDAAGAVHVDAR